MGSTCSKPSRGLPLYSEWKPKSLKCLTGFYLSLCNYLRTPQINLSPTLLTYPPPDLLVFLLSTSQACIHVRCLYCLFPLFRTIFHPDISMICSLAFFRFLLKCHLLSKASLATLTITLSIHAYTHTHTTPPAHTHTHCLSLFLSIPLSLYFSLAFSLSSGFGLLWNLKSNKFFIDSISDNTSR